MFLLVFLLLLVAAYGLFAIVTKFFPLKRDVPTGEVDRLGRKVTKQESIKFPLGNVAFIGAVSLIFILSLIVKIDAQSVGVVTTPNGVREDALNTGWHIILPWNDVHIMDKTVWVYTCADSPEEGNKANSDAIWAPTKDGIKIGFDVSVSWRIIADQAPWIYSNITENEGVNGRYLWLEENFIRTKLKSALALTVANYTPIEAYSTERQAIQDEILKRITDECQQYRIQIDNVDVREVYYNKEYELAINAKKLAEQEVLRLVEVTRQKNELLLQASIEKDIQIQTAQGQAETLKIKGDAIAANPKIVTLEWIEAWKSGGAKVPNFIGGQGGNMFMLDLNAIANNQK